MRSSIVSRSVTRRNQIVVTLQAPLAPELARQVCQQVALLVESAAAEGIDTVSCHMVGRVDVVVVDVLLQVQLLVRRSGLELLVSARGPSLVDLAVLTGLVEALPPIRATCLRLGGQAEPGEQRRVEEVVHVGHGPV